MRENQERFEDHIGLLKSVVRSFDKTCRPEDSELFPLACVALIRAISTFDQSKSKFSYWATKIMKNELLGEVRKSRLVKESTSDFDGCEFAFTKNKMFASLELADILVAPSDSDSPSDSENKRMLKRHYMDGVSMAEIAREVGITREYVRQRIKKAIDSIRKNNSKLIDDHFVWLSGPFLSAGV